VENLLQNLNEPQRQAVVCTEGPVLVLAGAGSGKTKALTHRIAYLIREKQVSPYNILAVTFTNKAAKEMQSRVEKLLSQNIESGVRNNSLDEPRNSSFTIHNSSGSVRLPWLGTFHSVCVRILRREAEMVGYSRNFTIYDASDQKSIIKRIMRDLSIDPKEYNPSAVLNFISGAKNELVSATEYKKYINSPFEKVVSKVFDKYSAYLKRTNAMDFDDLIAVCVRLFQENPDVLLRYQQQFRYILIDEYQDTNEAQYIWVKLLSKLHQNIMVVGDDYQCLAPESKICIDAKKSLSIQDIKVGHSVSAAAGWGSLDIAKVQKIHKTKYSGYLIRIKTKSNKILELTPNHKIFADLQMKSLQYYVYLMYRSDKGYRIGITQGVRGKKRQIVNGLVVRINQERGDKIWMLKSCETHCDALYYEQFYAFKYGLPTTIFEDSSKKAVYSQSKIDELFQNIPTVERAKKMAHDLDLDLSFPHHQPQAVTRNGKGRKIVNLLMFGENRCFESRHWHSHRISLNTTDVELKLKLSGIFPVRNGLRGTWRVETSRKDYSLATDYVGDLLKYDSNLSINQKARLMEERSFSLMPAKNLRAGMAVPVVIAGKICTDEVIAVERFDYKGDMFDLDIANLHNFVASGIIVHNSIYSWRGANFRNILNFEKHYPDAKVIKLEQNYRSTKTILEAANEVIKYNKKKTEKTLWTEKKVGPPITIYEAANEKDEAEFCAMEIKSLRSRKNESGIMNYGNNAVLYRTNAQSRAVEEAFLRFNIPYRVVGGTRFYDRKEIKDVIAYLRLINNPTDLESLARAVSCVPVGIGEKTLAQIGEISKSEFLNPKEIVNPKISKKLINFIENIAGFRAYGETHSLPQLIETIAEKSGMRKYLLDGTPEGERRWENVLELIGVAGEVQTQWSTINDQLSSNDQITNSEDADQTDQIALELFLEQIALVQDHDETKNQSTDAVTLMTLHSAKGLEFENVFIVGVEEGLFPHSRAITDESEMEEERRLAYVGITRAKERLYLIYARERSLYGKFQANEKSRFIESIPEGLLDII